MMNLLRNIVPLGSSAPLGVQFKTSPDLERSREARISTKAQPHRTSSVAEKPGRLKAFTLFESTVAVTIITIVLGMSTLIYSNILDAENPVVLYQAKQEIDRILIDTKESKAFFTKTFEYETYDIKQEVDPYKGNQKLYQIKYTVVLADKDIWQENHLVANTEHE